MSEAAEPTENQSDGTQDDSAELSTSPQGDLSTKRSSDSVADEPESEAGTSDEVDQLGADAETAADEADSAADPALNDPAQLVAAVEAILFVVDSPLTVASLASALRQPIPAVDQALATLRESYDLREAGIELRDSAGGVRIYTRPAHARHVERFLQDGQRSRLSQAALETLAVIAYRQPVTRSRVSAIRGVNVDGVVRTLLTRGLIVEVGTDPESGAGLFRTSELFLERMGMQSLEELPSLAPLLPDLDGLETEEL